MSGSQTESSVSLPWASRDSCPSGWFGPTDRFAGLAAATAALHRYSGAGKVVWRHVPLLCLLSVIGALIGSTLLIRVEPEILQPAIAFLLVALLPVLFLKRDLGVAAREVTQRQLILGFVLYLFVQILSGFFHAGMGVIIFFILMAFVGLTIVEVAATQMLPFIALATASPINSRVGSSSLIV